MKLESLKHNLGNLPFNQLIIETSKPIGLARFKAIQRVTTEWFAFIDDDITILETWSLPLFIREDIGAIEGRKLIKGLGLKWDKAINDFIRQKPPLALHIGQRGMTSNVLLRTSIAKEWKPRYHNEFCMEDYDLSQFIMKKGFKWLVVNNYVIHHKTWSDIVTSAIWNMRGYKLFFRPLTIMKIYAKFLLSIPFWLLKYDIDKRVRFYIIFQNLCCIWGLTRPC